MLPPIETARQWIRDCLPQCAASESEWFGNMGVVFVEEANMHVNKECVTKCYEAAKVAFRIAAETGQIATDSGKKVVQVAAEELTKSTFTLWCSVAAFAVVMLLYNIRNR